MDKYEIIEEIVGGKMILVWHKSERKKYILKRIHLERPTEGWRQSIRRELALIARIRSPYVVEFKEAWMEEGCHVCIVMGYCEGGNMAELIKEANGSLFPEVKLCKWLAQLLLAVDYLHSNHVIHHNLKCSNIFLTRDHDIQLGDFGLAKIPNSNHLTSSVAGTSNYLCPELIVGNPCSFKSDIWSLGCCMFEIAAHRPAFRAHGTSTSNEQHCHQEPQYAESHPSMFSVSITNVIWKQDMPGLISKINRSSVGTLPSMYSSSVKGLIKIMLRKNPDERPTAADLLKHPHLQKYVVEYIRPPPLAFCPSPMRKRGNKHQDVEVSTINHYSSSLSTESDNSFCSVTSSGANGMKCTNSVLHLCSLSGSGNDTTVTNSSVPNIQKDQDDSMPNSSDKSGSTKIIPLDNLPVIECTYEFHQSTPLSASLCQTNTNHEVSVPTDESRHRKSLNEDPKLSGYRGNSSKLTTPVAPDSPASLRSYKERAEALESLLELCAQLLKQRRLEELAGVLKPFGQNGASPRETAIWLTQSVKAVNDEQNIRAASL